MSIDTDRARDEEGYPCGACVDDRDWRACRCVEFCGADQCTGAEAEAGE